ncbi:hypothetical protein RDABS01_009437 [Bienertia sinuspersici]
MMNFIALSLIATSLLVSGLFSPNAQSNGGKQEQVILKEGHRAVTVEYADDVKDGNTKVLISPQQPNTGPVDEQLSRAAASVAGVAQEVVPGQNGLHGSRPRELICDAYGKCKHKIAGAWGKTKEKAAEAEEAVEEAVGKVKDSAEGVRQDAKEKVREAGEAVGKTGEIGREKLEKVKAKTGEMGEMGREKVEKMKGNAGEMVEETEDMIKEKSIKGKKELSDIGKRGKEVILDAIWYVCAIGYVLSKETLNSMLSVTQLLGFASAYGVSVWVTFIMSHVLAGVLPRQQFGMVQSKIYPVYFKTMVGSIGLALVGHLMGHRGKMFRNKADMFQGYNLMTSLLLVLGNLLFLEPRATKTMFNRMKLEKEEGRGRDKDHVSAPTRVIDTVVDDTTSPAPTATTTATTEPTTTTLAAKAAEDEAKTKLGKLDNRLKKLNSYSSLLNIMTLMGLTWHLVYLSQRLRANAC